jgi:prevent-host-death family protein
MNKHNVWQVQEAKARLSEMMRLSETSPQFISFRGKEKSVLLDIELYRKLTHSEESLLDFLQQSPLYGLSLSFERDKSPLRDIEL